MFPKTTPLIKGLITGLIMVTASLLLVNTNQPANSPLQYLIYLFYAGGIAWTLNDYFKSDSYEGKFGSIFGQGFRCFIIVTLIIVAFTGIYSSLHPEIAAQSAELFRKDLIKEGNKTPAEIETIISNVKKQFTVANMSVATFSTLITGSLFTAAGAGLLLIRRK